VVVPMAETVSMVAVGTGLPEPTAFPVPTACLLA
jgi:hypothetical protein